MRSLTATRSSDLTSRRSASLRITTACRPAACSTNARSAPSGAQENEQIESAHARQHPVDEQQIERCFSDPVERRFSVGRLVCVEAGALETERNHLANGAFVIDDQYPVRLHVNDVSARPCAMTGILQRHVAAL